MSKKKKVSPGKAGNKTPAKKAMKKSAKPVAKNKATKKPASKPAVAKKVTKVVKKVLKSAAKNPKAAKKVIKKVAKVIKTVKTVAKSIAKKAISKPVSNNKNASKSSGKAVVSNSKTSSKDVKKPEIQSSAKNGKTHDVKSQVNINNLSSKKAEVNVAPAAEKAKKQEEAPTKKQIAERKSNDVLAITNTIPVKQKNEISPSKIASISHSITNPIKKTDSYAVRPEKEPAGKFEMEFVVHSSAEMLYEFLSTPSGLSEWFCDDLNIRNGIYTFIWDDQLQQARLLKTVDLQLVRFQWVDKTDGSYFEFRIQRDDLTNDIALIITDFAETASERESSKLLWHSQIEKLMHVIGSIF